MYQFSLTRFMGGRISMNSPSSRPTTLPQPSRMWRFSDSALYCVRMYTRRRSELMQLDKRDVDDAVDAAEGDGRLGAVAGQRVQTLTRSARQ